MKDIYFNDYGNKKISKRSSKEDTCEIPITRSEREMQERLNQQRYEQIIKRQNQEEDPYAFIDINSVRQTATQNSRTKKQTDNLNGNRQTKSTQSAKRTNNVGGTNDKPSKPKKKKGCGCGTVFLCFLVIFAILIGSCGIYFKSAVDKMNYVPLKDNAYIYDSELKSSSSVYNILLIGADTDEYGTSRSDTMMLVSLDKSTKTLKFTSFMRDMWVEIPDYKKAKLNASFSHGGAQLLVDTLEYNFKIKIDNYLLVDFDMFEKLIDAMGGVTVEITEKEAEFINRTSHAKVKAGTNTLNGDYALIYCRIRKLDSDFMRTQRQRKVMTALFEKIKSQSIFKTAKAMTDIMPLVTTDLEDKDIIKLGLQSFSLLKYGNDQLQIPVDGGYT
ncbi:MAG: LCP family protein [Clostridia bacterium]|nr:LCP family protein [Clostridia bacterium]